VLRSSHVVAVQDDAQDARWYPLNDLPPIAFDHALIIRSVVRVYT